MWVRGLKHGSSPIRETGVKVAPYVGAWIETSNLDISEVVNTVAPYVGAWIETIDVNRKNHRAESHPMWVRGLKQLIVNYLTLIQCRTLCGCVD